MRAISRSRKVPVTIAPPPLAPAAPRKQKWALRPTKNKKPRGGLSTLLLLGGAALRRRSGTGLPPPPAHSETRGGPRILPELPRQWEHPRGTRAEPHTGPV